MKPLTRTDTAMTMKRPPERIRPFLLLAGILLIAANLRAPITGAAPILEMIRDMSGLGTAVTGALTTLPLLAFAITSPFCMLLGREYGLERISCVALCGAMTAFGYRAGRSLHIN